jgi:hypothetical protein
MADHVIDVVADHPAVVDMAEDLAADTRRLLVLDADAFVAVVLMDIVLLVLDIVLLVIILVIIIIVI